VGKTTAALRIRNDDPVGLPALLARSLAALDAVLLPRTPFYLFTPAGPAGTEFRLALREIGWEHRQTLAWVKDSIVLGHSDFHYQHEEVLFGYTRGAGRPGRGGHRGSRWYGGNNQSSVLFFDRPKASREHPTSKPVALIEALIRCSTRRGELVLDPFAGSGSTLLASERLGRRCAAIELDAGYCDLIRRRHEEVTAHA
jgi:site-specific DNA-methyltransferase (adenine-specific)